MMHYRLYVLDDKAHIIRGIDLHCRNDDEAIAEAAAYEADHGVEIWRREIKVACLKPVPEAQPAA